VTVYELQDKILGQLPWGTVVVGEVFMFIRHCRDNFMDCLAALIAGNDTQHLMGDCQTCKLIKRLEEEEVVGC